MTCCNRTGTNSHIQGTGTKVGDPIEATAIHNALGQGRTARDPLYIGSIKSNIGHLEAASGIAAVIKAVMMLERGFLLPNHDFKEPNEKIPWKEWNLKVLKRQQPWPKSKKYISVNNFGFGGTNAHVVLGKAPSVQKPQPAKPTQAVPQESTSMLRLFTNARSSKAQEAKPASSSNTKLFVMTANDKASLLAVMKKMVVYLEQRPEIFQKDLMENFAYTLGQRRSLLQWRAAIATDSSFDLIESINSDKIVPCKQSAEKPRLGFIFTGQGAQWHAMGRELYHQYPIYAAAIDRSNECLRQLGADWSLSQELLERDAKNTKVGEAHISQPSCTAVQLALVDLLRSWDIEPVAVVGHSSGEIGAAYAAGLLSFESAMAVAYHRGRLVPVLKKRHSGLNGAMMAVGGTPAEIQPLIDGLTDSAHVEGKVSVACYNSPSSLTISGDATALTALEDELKSKHPDMFCRRLQVDTAYHCHHMNMIADEYRESIVRQMEQGSQCNNEPAQFFSSLHGHRVDGLECAHAEYWVRNLTNPVRFSEALDHMVKEADLDMLVELGPHSALQGPVKQILKAAAASTNGESGTAANRDLSKLPYSSALARGKNALQTALDLAGGLFARGALVNMEAINFPGHYHYGANGKLPSLLTDLPTYPFNHQHRFWHEPRLAHAHRYRGASARNDLIGLEAIYSNDLEPTWRNIVRLDDLPWLRHHEIQSVTIFPISGYAAMALEALAKWCQKRDVGAQVTEFELKDIEVLKPLVFSGGDSDVEMTICLRPSDPRDPEAWMEFEICSWTQDAGWTRHCVGLAAVQLGAAQKDEVESTKVPVSSLRREVCGDIAKGETTAEFPGEEMYAQLSDLGVSYGPSFQGIKHSKASRQCSTAGVAVVDVARDMPSEHVSCEVIQPNLLEAIIQAYWPVALNNGTGSGTDATAYLPSSIGGLKISKDLVALAQSSDTTLQAFCKAAFPAISEGEEPRPSKASIVAAASSSQKNGEISNSECLVQIDDLKVSPVSGGEAQDVNTTTAAPRELCYKIEWEPLEEAQDSAGSSLPKLEPEIVVIHGTSAHQQTLAKSIAEAIYRATELHPLTGAMGEVDCEGKVVVVLDEIDQPFLARPTEVQFQQLKTALIGTGGTKPPHGVLWVTKGAAQPESGMITGLSRTVRSETLLPFATLDLESADDTQAVSSILSVLDSVFGPASATSSETQDSRELEFVSRNGRILTPRIQNDDSMNGYVQRKLDPSIPELQCFGKDGRCLKLNYGGLSKSSPGSLHFVDDDSTNEPLGPDEIEFEVKAIGTNSSDVVGDPNSKTHHLGIEASGIVTRVGEKSTTFTPGQRVAALALPIPGRQHGGMYRTRARSSTATAIHIPAALSFEDAAAMPLAYCTAYYAVVNQARVQEGQSVLIQYGDSSDAVSVGHAAVCLAQMLLGSAGQIYVAVGSEEQKQLVGRAYGIPRDRIFLSSRRGNVSAILHERRGLEHSKGVDAVICVGRSTSALGNNTHVAQDLWSCVAPFGCMVDVRSEGTAEGANTFSPVGSSAPRSNTSYFSLDMFELAAERPDVLKSVVSKVAGLVGNENLRSLPMVETRPLSEVEDTFKQLQNAQKLEKIVLTVDADCNILVCRAIRTPKFELY